MVPAAAPFGFGEEASCSGAFERADVPERSRQYVSKNCARVVELLPGQFPVVEVVG
jgi:hypothetical protein